MFLAWKPRTAFWALNSPLCCQVKDSGKAEATTSKWALQKIVTCVWEHWAHWARSGNPKRRGSIYYLRPKTKEHFFQPWEPIFLSGSCNLGWLNPKWHFWCGVHRWLSWNIGLSDITTFHGLIKKGTKNKANKSRSNIRYLTTFQPWTSHTRILHQV